MYPFTESLESWLGSKVKKAYTSTIRAVVWKIQRRQGGVQGATQLTNEEQLIDFVRNNRDELLRRAQRSRTHYYAVQDLIARLGPIPETHPRPDRSNSSPMLTGGGSFSGVNDLTEVVAEEEEESDEDEDQVPGEAADRPWKTNRKVLVHVDGILRPGLTVNYGDIPDEWKVQLEGQEGPNYVKLFGNLRYVKCHTGNISRFTGEEQQINKVREVAAALAYLPTAADLDVAIEQALAYGIVKSMDNQGGEKRKASSSDGELLGGGVMKREETDAPPKRPRLLDDGRNLSMAEVASYLISINDQLSAVREQLRGISATLMQLQGRKTM